MNADTFFGIGKTHEVCQDYARSGVTEFEETYAIVSDGCSSSPDTDFGARFLTMAAISHRNLYPKRPLDPLWSIWRAFGMLPAPLPSQCLDATLLGIFSTPTGVGVVAAGDGVIYARRRNGNEQIVNLDLKGAPSYLSYFLDPDRMKTYRAEGFGWRNVQTHYRVTGNVPFTLVDEETGEFKDSPPLTLWENGNTSSGPAALGFFPADTWDFVMVATDGVHSFQNAATLQPIPMVEVVTHLAAVKSFTGQFMTRRCRAFEKFCLKEGWQHNDDLGVAAIYLGEGKEES